MGWDYLSLASLEIVPWWNVGNVGSDSCIIPHWFCVTPHWFARAPPWLSGRPQFLPSDNLAEALAQFVLPLVAFPARPWILLGSTLALVSATRSPLGGAFMASMSCCKTGALLPLNPYGPCLVFLITLKGSITNADGIKFYRAPQWAPNVLTG